MSPTLTAAAPATTAAPTAAERFEALYRTSRDDVYAYVASLVRDPAAAEDVTAQAFERAFRRRRRWDARRGTERAWLFGIARNAALDELRRRGRTAGLTADPTDEPMVEDGEEETLRRESVRAALATLTPRERDLVALRFHGGLAHAEVARVLGVSESNAQTMLHRTLRKLREACHATS